MSVMRGVLVLSCLVLVPAFAWAQAEITGVVKDTSGAVLPGVTVEAASPALIEKVRAATTDGNGQYRIVDLRPGTYQVTFTLAGFNTFKRDGVVLSGSGTVTIEANLLVGAVEETITVTGEAPTVNVQTTTKQAVINSELIDAIPSARTYLTLGVLLPGVSSGINDVGGSAGDLMGNLSAHGNRSGDQRILQNGSALTGLQAAGGGSSGAPPNIGAFSEVTIDYGATSAEQQTSGVQINLIPRDGGNTFKGSTFFGYATEGMAANNFTQRLKDRGLTSVTRIKKNWDVNPGLGGPLKRDRVWFYATVRQDGAENYAAGMFYNRNAFKPDVWTYDADLSRPALSTDVVLLDEQVRVTWQVTSKHKVSGTFLNNNHCRCPDSISATRAPEAANDRRFPKQGFLIGEYKAPINNRVLIEAFALHKDLRWGTMHLHPKNARGGGSLDVSPSELALYPTLVGVTEQSSGLEYPGPSGTFINAWAPVYNVRAAMSYVTGSHNAKFGWQDSFGYTDRTDYMYNVPYRYRFNNGVPNQITQYTTPIRYKHDQNRDLGLFAQDRWTINRLTLIGALRFDYYRSGYPEQTLGPAPLVPNRNWTFPSEANLNWKDLSWRSGAAYDLRGQGKTALRVGLNKYLAGQALGGLGSNTNPVLRLVNDTTRSWADANRNFFPETVTSSVQTPTGSAARWRTVRSARRQ